MPISGSFVFSLSLHRSIHRPSRWTCQRNEASLFWFQTMTPTKVEGETIGAQVVCFGQN